MKKFEEVFEVIEEMFRVDFAEYERYVHAVFGNPFTGEEALEEVMDTLCHIAEQKCLDVEGTFAYGYAMAMFDASFFPNDIIIVYTYPSEQAYDFGAAKVSWKRELH